VTDQAPINEITARIARADDATAVRMFRCAGRRPRYADTAQKLTRRCAAVLAGDVPEPAGFRCMLFEADDPDGLAELTAVSATMTGDDRVVCDWIVMGVAIERQGTRLPDGRSIAVAVAEETARFARSEGYELMVAQVDRRHAKSLHILERLGFVEVDILDVDYRLFATQLTQSA
jgi:hypothetical protein